MALGSQIRRALDRGRHPRNSLLAEEEESMSDMGIFQQLAIWTPRLVFLIVADAKTTTLIYRLCQRSRTADKAGIAVVGRRDAVRARRQ